MKLAIVTTHPVQYNAPWFQLLARQKDISVKVFYTWGQAGQGKTFDPGFGKVIQWDVPLLNGYEFVFIRNTASDPGTHHFKGIITPGLNKEIEEWQPDSLLVFGWSFQSHLDCLRHFHGKVQLLFRGDSTLIDETGGLKTIIRRCFLRWVYRHIDIALYTGTNNKAYFVAHGLKEKQLAFVPHAIDNDRFADPEDVFAGKAKEWRAELGFTEDDIIILFAGKLEPKKAPGILLELAQRITDKRVKFLLVGNGKQEKELKEKAAPIGNIQFLDFQNQSMMPVVYRLGNVFLLPSPGPGETWGLAMNEAMACGLPVIATDKVGGAIDLIKPGENGFIFSPGDVDSLHKQLMIYMDRAKLASMGKRSEEIISTWNFDRIVDSIQLIVNN